MKKSILIIFSLCITMLLQAQVSKTVSNLAAGGLNDSISLAERSTITNLTLKGTIDARDFKTMRDSMPVLAVVDLSGTTVVEYKGTEGTIGTTDTTYIANAIPECAFCSYGDYIGKKTITSFVFPASITVIGADAFDDCTALIGTFSIPSAVDSIGIYAFYGCTGLSSIELPPSLKHIPEGCFQNTTGLTGEIIIPPLVDTIGAYSFSRCAGLTSITIPVSVTYIASFAFANCTGLTTLNIPLSVTYLGPSAFAGCTGLTSVSIPSSVTAIERGAFSGCTSLTSVYVDWTIPLTIQATVFGNVDKTNCTLYVPLGTVAAYDGASTWTDFIIVEKTTQTVNNTTSAPIKVSVQNGQVVLTGVASGEVITIYNLQGVAIYNQKATAEIISVNLPTHGMYVVKVEVQSFKVVY